MESDESKLNVLQNYNEAWVFPFMMRKPVKTIRISIFGKICIFVTLPEHFLIDDRLPSEDDVGFFNDKLKRWCSKAALCKINDAISGRSAAVRDEICFAKSENKIV